MFAWHGKFSCQSGFNELRAIRISKQPLSSDELNVPFLPDTLVDDLNLMTLAFNYFRFDLLWSGLLLRCRWQFQRKVPPMGALSRKSIHPRLTPRDITISKASIINIKKNANLLNFSVFSKARGSHSSRWEISGKFENQKFLT